MKKYITTATLSFALIAVTPAFAEEAHKKEDAHKHDEKGHVNKDTKAHSDEHAVKHADDTATKTSDSAVKKGPNKPTEYAKEAEAKVDSEVDKLRKSIIADATEAVIESNKALMALENDKPKEAISAIKTGIGKLAVTLERDPTLGLKPINVMKTVHALTAEPAIIQKKIEAAEKHLKDGQLQHARILLSPLVSDMTITTTSIPLSTYPESLKAVVPLIDAGKTQEAKVALSKLLSTLVTKELVIPLPPLHAEAALMAAEVLVQNEKRTEEENEKLKTLLSQAHEELKISELLGYGNKEAFKPMHELINEIEKKMADGKGGKGWFDGIKKGWGNLFSGKDHHKLMNY